MLLLSDNEALDWCLKFGVRQSRSLLSDRITLPDVAGRRLRITVADDATAVVGQAYILLMTSIPRYEESAFDGALIWLQRWEIWSESIDRVGYELLNGVRRRPGDEANIDEAPAQVFAHGEFVSAQACLSLPMMFQWDAYFVPAKAPFIAFISHEGFVEFQTRREEDSSMLRERFDRYGPADVPAES